MDPTESDMTEELWDEGVHHLELHSHGQTCALNITDEQWRFNAGAGQPPGPPVP